MDCYKLYKHDFKYERYLDCVTNVKQRKVLSQFRLSSQYIGIVRHERKCKLCIQNVCEFEYHFLL